MAKIQKKKFFEIDLPLIGEKYEAYSGSVDELKGRTIKTDLTRKLKGKSVELVFQVSLIDGKATGIPKRMILLPFFIRHMLHTGIDYVEDSIAAETKDSHVIIKPFLITRKKVSRAVRRTLRNSAKNWLVDYLKTKTDEEVFNDILSNMVQKPLSLKLKKTYPLAVCEIRIFEVKKPLVLKAAEVKPVGEIIIKAEVKESEDGKIKEVKEEITENIEIKEEKEKKKPSKKKEA